MSATVADHPASWSLGPSLTFALHRSWSIGMAHVYLTFTSPSTTASELHTCTTQAKRHVAHIAFAMVGLVTTQPSSWITLTITHHKTNHKGTFQPCVRRKFGKYSSIVQRRKQQKWKGEKILPGILKVTRNACLRFTFS
jgi:hypothetical protein